MGEIFAWHAMPVQEVLRSQASRSTGLTPEEARRRLAEYGYNRLPQPSPTRAIVFLFRQFKSPLILVLVVAAAISVSLGHVQDALLTLFIMGLNALLGFVQEYRADRSLLKLAAHLAQQATVRREGKVLRVEASEVVPGDVLLLAPGDRIVADARVLHAQACATNESSLTGESAEVKKSVEPVPAGAIVQERVSMFYAGTLVAAGTGEGLVVATAAQTEFGQVAGMVSGVKDDDTPLEKELKHFANTIVGVALFTAGIVFLLGFARQMPWLSILAVAAALAVAVVPEGLMVSLTVILSLGMRRMYKKKALVRRLVAAETLGSVSVVCVDKTGTLTTGEMTLTEMRHGAHVIDPLEIDDGDEEMLLALAAFVDQEAGAEVRKSATQAALRKYFYDLPEANRPAMPSVSERLAFDPTQKFSGRTISVGGVSAHYALGAPDVLLERSDIDDATRQAYQATLRDMTRRGLRVLMVAVRRQAVVGELTAESLRDLTPLGLLGLEDPLRPGATETLQEAAQAGIRVVMVTGDHPETAAAVGRALGLLADGGAVMTGSELQTITDDELVRKIAEIRIFARVLPEQKMRIVRAFQAKGFSVAMTGDGVNDAPALKAAEIGIAVADGTDVAREAADMVLLDNDVKAIIEAIREGRRMYDNLRKVILYLVTFSLTEIALIAGVLMIGLPVPFAPLHILWINVATDGLPAMALAAEPAEADIMRRAPRRQGESLISHGMRKLMFLAGTTSVVLIMSLYVGATALGFNLEVVRTLAFVSLGLNSVVSIFALRVFYKPLWSVKFWANPALLLTVLSSMALLLLPVVMPNLAQNFGFTTLTEPMWLIIVGIASIKLVAIEVGKSLFLRQPRALGVPLLH